MRTAESRSKFHNGEEIKRMTRRELEITEQAEWEYGANVEELELDYK